MGVFVKGTKDYNVFVNNVVGAIISSIGVATKRHLGLRKLGYILSDRSDGNIIWELCEAFNLEYAYYACWGTLINGETVYEKLDGMGTPHLQNILKLKSASLQIKDAIGVILKDRGVERLDEVLANQEEVLAYQELELMDLEDKVFALESILDNINRLKDEATTKSNTININTMGATDNNEMKLPKRYDDCYLTNKVEDKPTNVSEGFKEAFRKNTTFLRGEEKEKTLQEFEEYINSQKSRTSLL